MPTAPRNWIWMLNLGGSMAEMGGGDYLAIGPGTLVSSMSAPSRTRAR